jgi:hypothetical protein
MPASWTTPYLMRVLLVTLFMVPPRLLASRIGRKNVRDHRHDLLAQSAISAGFTVTARACEHAYVWFLMIAIGFPLVSINLGPLVLELGKDSDARTVHGDTTISPRRYAQIVTPTIASFFINVLGFQNHRRVRGRFRHVACVCGFFAPPWRREAG